MSNRSPQFQWNAVDLSVVKLPPADGFVSLSHAISWIAFQHSIGAPDLNDALDMGKPRKELNISNNIEKDAAISDAVLRLTDLGSSGAVDFRGQYFLDVLVDPVPVLTQEIPQVRLADYRCFDTLDDSLHRGIGLTWNEWRNELLYPEDTRHFRFVTVRRSDLLREFPIGASYGAYSTGKTEKECRKWLLLCFEDDPQHRRSKAHFKEQAREKFETLSGRGFDRVWGSVAGLAGRNKAGAKSKR